MIDIVVADYRNKAHADALVQLMDEYARDPAGGGSALPAEVKNGLPEALAARPSAFSVLAFEAGQAVGLINCFEGFSTFACRPLVNVHDVVVVASHRGQRITQKMLVKVEELARERGACKLTLEVLSGNVGAMRAYEREGFAGYQLDPAFGTATFMHKKL
ncbi:GNAT family N-acetyltransferase [Variovorax sp. J22R133]|uniref:GNAT family N-acetyltransferase n=1 Tax=Variovorax brevis TaxID=3053503 RepID=UPI0025780218|nr:GNAT family N-acetyltransferase [Variovorax sp. J22R133]MDM0112453.1 GNAT family N-acetyltransferase [Variovorax sp. J22R133]